MRRLCWGAALLVVSCGGRVAPPDVDGQQDGGGGADGGGTDGGGPPPPVPCSFSDQCEGASVCDRVEKRCVQCRTSADCPAAKGCEAGLCKDALACTSDLQCTPKGLVCDAEAHRCVQCNSAADCKGGGPCLGHSCVPYPKCTSSLDCSSVGMVCAAAPPPRWPADYAGKGCQECASIADCPQKSSCHDGLCYEACVLAGAKCGTVDGAACGACSAAGACTSLHRGCWRAVALAEGSSFNGFALTATSAFVSFDGRGGGDTFYGRVYRIRLSDGHTDPIAQPNKLVGGLAANSTHVFWSEHEVVKKYPKGGGSASEVGRLGSGDGFVRAIQADDTSVYVAFDYGGTIATGIYKLPAGGGEATPLTTGKQVLDALVLAGDRLYWNDYNGRVSYTKVSGGDRGVSTGGRQVFGRMAVDGTHLYWGDTDGVRRVPRDGGTPELFLAEPEATPLAIIDGVLYYAARDAGGGSEPKSVLGKVRIGGASERILGPEDNLPGRPAAVGLNGAALFFVVAADWASALVRYDPL